MFVKGNTGQILESNYKPFNFFGTHDKVAITFGLQDRRHDFCKTTACIF